jgi:hypothetical protein
MDTHIIFLVMLEAIGLVLALIAVWSYVWSKKNAPSKKIEAALESHLHGMLTAELEVVEKELKKAVHAAHKDAAAILETNHEELREESKKLLNDFAQNFTTEMTTLLKEEHTQISSMFAQKSTEIVQELAEYRAQKIAELDAKSDELVAKLVQQKVWRSVKAADSHEIAKQAIQTIIASGELSG